MDDYLSSVDLSEIVVERGPNQLTGNDMCELLFGDHLSGEHIDMYLGLLCSESVMKQHGHDIDYLWSPAQDFKNKTYSEFDASVDSFRYFGTTTFNKLNLTNIYNKRYIMMPINPKNHWFLLVINLRDKYKHHWNSIGHSPNYPKVADYTADFTADWWQIGSGWISVIKLDGLTGAISKKEMTIAAFLSACGHIVML